MTPEFLKKSAGSLEEIDIRCPKCNSSKVLVSTDKEGYYDVLECLNCGYKKSSK
jgi:Zn ribbon nucleic-acid-binding protein